MNEKITLESLYRKLRPAFFVKIRVLKLRRMEYIKMEDIWNYLKEQKWILTNNLTIAEMVNDIIHVENYDVDNYVKSKLMLSERKIYF